MATQTRDSRLLSDISHGANTLTGDDGDFNEILNLARGARFVLLGESTHGTEEFYQARARLTRRLIAEGGFHAVAVEADWPDAYRVNRYVRGDSPDRSAEEALGGFVRFPQWMWRNTQVVQFTEWLRAYNADFPAIARAGFYGLDLYSLYASADHVVRYLEHVDPEAAQSAKRRYACFGSYDRDPHSYALALRYRYSPSCEREATEQLRELLARAITDLATHADPTDEELFNAVQNARVVKNAERYYRTMFFGSVSSWNLRDSHMAETLEILARHLDRLHGLSRIVVWEHNSHIGDARATAMGDEGEHNIGQLIRERYGDDAVLIGFTTHSGTVTAASDWDMPAERMIVRPALAESYEDLFHRVEADDFALILRDHDRLSAALRGPRLERAIGVVYRPHTERLSHYFSSHLSDQFDAVIHYDVTTAVEPLERTPRWKEGEVPETFPTGV